VRQQYSSSLTAIKVLVAEAGGSDLQANEGDALQLWLLLPKVKMDAKRKHVAAAA
jgi:hypothetical protein